MLGTGKADDVGRDAALRVGPGVAGGLLDAGQAHRRDLAAGLDRNALGQHHVLPRGGVLELVQDRGGGQAERPGQRVGDLLPLGRRDQRRVGGHRVGGHGHGQHLPVGAGDAAAHGGQRYGVVPLLGRQLAVVTRLHGLQLDQAAGEQRQHEDDREQGNAQPAGLVAAGGLAAGGPGRAGRLGVGRPFPRYGGRTGRGGAGGGAGGRERGAGGGGGGAGGRAAWGRGGGGGGGGRGGRPPRRVSGGLRGVVPPGEHRVGHHACLPVAGGEGFVGSRSVPGN